MDRETKDKLVESCKEICYSALVGAAITLIMIALLELRTKGL